MAKLRLERVCKKYRDVIAVQDLSFECVEGEFFSLLGPSGCGKSSTVRMIAGIEEITAGEIYFDNIMVNNIPPRERNIAMVFENYALYPYLTVYENIAFPLRVRNMSREDIDKKVKWAAEFLNLEDILNNNVRSLSGGQKQRVSIGRAIVREPAILLMDEPISHLEAGLRTRMREELKRFHIQLGVTTVYITHDQLEAMTMADRVGVMNRGLLLQVGTPEEVYDRPRSEFVAGFIGEPPMNFLDGELRWELEKPYIDFPSFSIEVKGEASKKLMAHKKVKNIRLGVRPENIRVISESGNGAIKALIDMVEPQGERTILSVKLENGEILLAESSPHLMVKEGERVSLDFDRNKIYIFSRESGENLVY